MLLTLALLSHLALADTITLDSGAVIDGEIAEYQPSGDCRIAVTGGPLEGATVTLPCRRLARFERDPNDFAPVAPAAVEEVEVQPAPPPALTDIPEPPPLPAPARW